MTLRCCSVTNQKHRASADSRSGNAGPGVHGALPDAVALLPCNECCRTFGHAPAPHLPEGIPCEGIIAEEVVASEEAPERRRAPASSPEHRSLARAIAREVRLL